VIPQVETIVNFLGNKTWLTGNQLTWLDFILFETICFLDFLSDGQTLQNYATLASYHHRFTSLPEFAHVWADDSKTMKWPYQADMAGVGSRTSGM
jgi:glutathione S-transferase